MPPRERKKPLNERLCTVGRLKRAADQPPLPVVAEPPAEQQVERANNGGEQVVGVAEVALNEKGILVSDRRNLRALVEHFDGQSVPGLDALQPGIARGKIVTLLAVSTVTTGQVVNVT